jgi:hypothetical protein
VVVENSLDVGGMNVSVSSLLSNSKAMKLQYDACSGASRTKMSPSNDFFVCFKTRK